MAYPIQFNNKYKIWHFVIRHFIVSAVKLKNAKFDSIGSYLYKKNFNIKNGISFLFSSTINIKFGIS